MDIRGTFNDDGGDDELLAHLDFVRSDIDPATVKPIDSRHLASVINEFLLCSADILNEFCVKFEKRMIDLDIRLDTFERMLALMERKLENINIDEVIKVIKEKAVTEMGAEVEDRMSALNDQQKETPRETAEEKRPTDEKEEKAPKGTIKAKEHPKAAKYFRMLKMGVPEAAVRQKMKSEGVDDAILNDPDKPITLALDENTEQISRISSFPLAGDGSLSEE